MFGLGLPEILLILIILGMFVGFLALLVFGVRLIANSARGTKTCPFCAERIQAAAVICRFCNRDVSRGAGV